MNKILLFFAMGTLLSSPGADLEVATSAQIQTAITQAVKEIVTASKHTNLAQEMPLPPWT